MKIYCAVPTSDGNVEIGLSDFLLRNKEKLSVIDFSQVKPLISNSNWVFNKFLASDCTHLLWIDNDVIPDYGFLSRAILKDSDIYSGRVPFWPMQFSNPMICAGHKVQEKYRFINPTIQYDEPIDVDFCGFGCVMIKRQVIEKLKSKYGGNMVRQEFSDIGFITKGIDIIFCELAKSEGFRIILDNGPIMNQIVMVPLKRVVDTLNDTIQRALKHNV